MDKQFIKENDIEIRYLRNQLSADDCAAFEVYLMENPEMVDQLELTQGLLDAADSIPSSSAKPSNFWLDAIGGVLAAPKALISGLSVGVLSTVMIMSTGFFSADHIAVNQVAALSQLRGSNNSSASRTVLEFPEQAFDRFNNETFVLSVPANIQPNTAYTASIFSQHSDAHKMTVKVDELQSDEFGSFYLVLKVNSFQPGVYRLEVETKYSELTESNIDSYVFETRVKG